MANPGQDIWARKIDDIKKTVMQNAPNEKGQNAVRSIKFQNTIKSIDAIKLLVPNNLTKKIDLTKLHSEMMPVINSNNNGNSNNFYNETILIFKSNKVQSSITTELGNVYQYECPSNINARTTNSWIGLSAVVAIIMAINEYIK